MSDKKPYGMPKPVLSSVEMRDVLGKQVVSTFGEREHFQAYALLSACYYLQKDNPDMYKSVCGRFYSILKFHDAYGNVREADIIDRCYEYGRLDYLIALTVEGMDIFAPFTDLREQQNNIIAFIKKQLDPVDLNVMPCDLLGHKDAGDAMDKLLDYISGLTSGTGKLGITIHDKESGKQWHIEHLFIKGKGADLSPLMGPCTKRNI